MNRELVIVDRREYLKTLDKLDISKVAHIEFKVAGLSSICYIDKESHLLLAQSLYFPAGINEYRINRQFKENECDISQ